MIVFALKALSAPIQIGVESMLPWKGANSPVKTRKLSPICSTRVTGGDRVVVAFDIEITMK